MLEMLWGVVINQSILHKKWSDLVEKMLKCGQTLTHSFPRTQWQTEVFFLISFISTLPLTFKTMIGWHRISSFSELMMAGSRWIQQPRRNFGFNGLWRCNFRATSTKNLKQSRRHWIAAVAGHPTYTIFGEAEPSSVYFRSGCDCLRWFYFRKPLISLQVSINLA